MSNDTLYGDAGNNTLSGGDGDDLLVGGAGNDSLDGGAGSDRFLVVPGDGQDTITGATGNGGDVVEIRGGRLTFDDVRMTVEGNGLRIAYGAGSDSVLIYQHFYADVYGAPYTKLGTLRVGGANYDLTAGLTLTGGAGVDSLYGTLYGDVIRAQDGDDFLYAKGGDDTIYGGKGDDYLTGEGGNDRYVFAVGDGQDRVAQAQGTGDVIEIKGALTMADVRIARGTGTDLMIYYGSGGDSIKLQYHFYSDVYDPSYSKVSALIVGGVSYSLTQGLPFTGTAATDTIRGTLYDDVIRGVDGGDFLHGDTGNDTIYGGKGDDFLSGEAGNDRYVFAVGDGLDRIAQATNNGGDIVEITGPLTIADVRLVKSTSGNDLYIYYGSGGDRVTLEEHFKSDVVGPPTTKLGTLIVGGVSYDLTSGLTLTGSAGADTLYGTRYDDTIQGMAGADFMYADVGNDLLLGGDRWDSMNGGDGNDTLDGGLDNDVMWGGRGDDLYYVDNVGDRANELANEGNDMVISSIDWALGADVEHLTLVGSAKAGTGNGLANWITGNELANTLSGGASADTLDGGAGADSLDGGIGNDLLLGGARWDTLIGGDGNDTLEGGLDNDLMYGGLGDDLYYVDHVGDRVNESAVANEGNDRVFSSVTWNMTANIETVVFIGTADTSGTGNSLHNTMTGNVGNNTLLGGTGHDTIYGGDGNDLLSGEIDSDVLDGGNGNDTLVGGQRWDTLTGGAGDDVLNGGTENDRMTGNAGNDSYFVDHVGDRVIELAGEGSDTVYTSIDWVMSADVDDMVLQGAAVSGTGNGLANRISGTSGANILTGGHGNDTLSGGAGADTLTGGTGRDDFVFGAAAVNGADQITDFVHGIDRLVFKASDYGFAAGHVLTAAQFTTGGSAVGTGAQFGWDAESGHLWWDGDGTGIGSLVDLGWFDGAPTVTWEDLLFTA